MRRFYLTCWGALVLALVALSAQAADWNLKITEDDSGKKLASLSIARPFWVELTNKTNHDQSLLSYVDRPFLQLAFLFTRGNGEDISVSMGDYSQTWNDCVPKVIAPGKSFFIKVDFGSKVWLHTNELQGEMTVKVIYNSQVKFSLLKSASTFDQSLSVWIGKVESAPMLLTVER